VCVCESNNGIVPSEKSRYNVKERRERDKKKEKLNNTPFHLEGRGRG
jgi:hypothetical protein